MAAFWKYLYRGIEYRWLGLLGFAMMGAGELLRGHYWGATIAVMAIISLVLAYAHIGLLRGDQ